MSYLASEREGAQATININPVTITVDRVTTATNPNGVEYRTGPASPVALTNPVRIVANKKERSKIVDGERIYYNDKVYWIIADYETVIQKDDEFDFNSRRWKIMDVESVTIDGGQLVNYQAQLKEITQGIA